MVDHPKKLVQHVTNHFMTSKETAWTTTHCCVSAKSWGFTDIFHKNVVPPSWHQDCQDTAVVDHHSGRPTKSPLQIIYQDLRKETVMSLWYRVDTHLLVKRYLFGRRFKKKGWYFGISKSCWIKPDRNIDVPKMS